MDSSGLSQKSAAYPEPKSPREIFSEDLTARERPWPYQIIEKKRIEKLFADYCDKKILPNSVMSYGLSLKFAAMKSTCLNVERLAR